MGSKTRFPADSRVSSTGRAKDFRFFELLWISDFWVSEKGRSDQGIAKNSLQSTYDEKV